MKIIVLLLSSILFQTSIFSAQKNLKDSLLNVINLKQSDSLSVKAYSSLCYIYRSINQDSAIYFGNEGLKLAKQIQWEKGISSCYKNLGIAKFEIGQYEYAIDYFMKSLKIDEQRNDQRGMASNYNYIGGVYNEQNRYNKAEEYYLKSMKIRETINDKKGLSASYNNLGLIYYNQGDYNKALDYFTRSLKIKEGSNDKYNIAGSYNNIGMTQAEMGHTELAIEFYQKSLDLRKEIGDKKGIAAILGNISILNNTLADSAKSIQEKKRFFTEAVRNGLECLQISNEINAVLWQNKTAESLQKAYKGLGNLSESLKYAELFIRTNDSLFRDDKIKAIAEIDVKYQTEKKEQLITLQKIQIEKKEAEAKQHKTFIYAISSGLLLVILLFIIALRAYRQKQKANVLLTKQKNEIEEKNEELNQQKEEIITQRDEIEAQRNQILERNTELNQKNEEIAAQRDFVIKQGDILSDQNKKLEEQTREITDSILYARRIQQVLLPKDGTMSLVFKENFILFKPKDIVSGDFYWIQQHKENIIFCVADCTGHGVPGAFMSMLGISFLNEITRHQDQLSANKILDELRGYVIDSLHQEGNTFEQKDGMDIALCIINLSTYELNFAGANRSVYIISEKNKNTNNEKILTELKGDKMPIGFQEKLEPFTNSYFQLYQNDILYLFTDGYVDQFGGEKETKFKISPFKELLLSICENPLFEQVKILDSTIENWKNSQVNQTKISIEQTDDITVLGIKI